MVKLLQKIATIQELRILLALSLFVLKPGIVQRGW